MIFTCRRERERGREREGGGDREGGGRERGGERERESEHEYPMPHVFARAPVYFVSCLVRVDVSGKGRQWWGRERSRVCGKEKEKAKLSSSFTNLAHISSILSILCVCVGLHC